MRAMASCNETGSFDSKYLFRTYRDFVASVTVGGGGGTDEPSISFVSSVSVSPCCFCTIAAMSSSESSAVVMTLHSRMIQTLCLLIVEHLDQGAAFHFLFQKQ